MTWIDTLLGRDRPLRTTTPPPPAVISSVEAAAAFCLDQFQSLCRTEAAYAYLQPAGEGAFRLTTSIGIGIPGRMDQAPPLLDAANVPERATVSERAGDRWLTLPCGSTLVLYGRLRRGQPATPEVMAQAEHLAAISAALVETARRLSETSKEADRLRTVLAASHMAGDVALKPHRTLELLFHVPLRLLGAADGGLVLQGPGGEGPSLAAGAGRGALLTVKLLGGAAPSLMQVPGRPDVVTGAALGILLNEGVRQVVRVPALVRGASDHLAGCAYYFLADETPCDDRQMAALVPLAEQFGRTVREDRATQQTASLYLETLRSLVTTMDGMVAYTVGHSERIARYAAMTAQELGLPSGQIEAIALGAHLHDVGMIAIDTNRFLQEGKLTHTEYEMVQEHTRIGAELVAPVNAALPLSPMVAHHHERWDGRGYPARLNGRDIPLGARIIAVADLFEAKTTGRAYRRPLPFQRAIADLQALAGTQLDPDVVAAFIRAYQRLGQAALPGQPLAPCWELRQIPANICAGCPNRLATTASPCWEQPDRRCSRHGEECASCLVYTEALGRVPGFATP